jgi:hypothetical protein
MHNIISEEKIKEILSKILNEEKVSRQEYNRVQFKLDDLSASLNETIKELRKVEDSLPTGLKGAVGGKLSTLMTTLTSSQKTISSVKEKVKTLKRGAFTQQVDEKKNKR